MKVDEGLAAVGGTELWVARVGAGEPVLVVHGGPLLDHGYLRPWLLPLATDHELVFFDQRLSGRSAGTVDSASIRLDTLVADMEAIRREFDLDRIHLLAHSWGGLLALQYALRHPDRVVSLVLVSPMAPAADLRSREEEALAARTTPDYTAETGRLRGDPGLASGDPAAIDALLRHGFRLQLRDPALADSLPLYVPGDYLERSRQFRHLAPDLAGYDLREDLGQLDVPTLILYGEDEPGGQLGGQALVEGMPDATLLRIPDAGHFSFMEAPGPFLVEVRKFWEATGRGR
jgi:proline iminopeptidase